MSSIHPSRTVSVSIERPPVEVHRFLIDPANLPRWATAFCRSVRREGDRWMMDTPLGEMGVRFVEANLYGVADHLVSPSPGVEIYVPMRVLPNGAGSEVLFTLFQTGDMNDERFAEDLRMVRRDLATLKSVLEG